MNSLAAGYLAEERFADADFERGELLSYACIVCHTLGPGEGHLIGPNLSGIFGRSAASAPDFPYSEALREAGIVWTPAELDTWLARPEDFVPGNLMVFAGIYSVSDRTDLLAYLLRETGAGEFTTAQ
ncbi:MAG: c-type cytochrome [Proteobacteria bacterium]|nr:c-type cytochrome [Pseudomonadota bacterium]